MLLQCGDERFERADAAGRGVQRDGLMRLPECHLQQHPLLELEPGDLRQPRPGERIGGRRAEVYMDFSVPSSAQRQRWTMPFCDSVVARPAACGLSRPATHVRVSGMSSMAREL